MEMRKLIMGVLNDSNKPLTFDEIADLIKLEKDTYVLMAELNNLTMRGSIKTVYKQYGGHLYSV